MARPKEFDPEVAVEQAMEVFWRKGYGATTPQDLVDALGIGKGSLYNAFGSKHGLFERALRRYRDTQTAALVEMLEQPGPVKERLGRVLRLLAEMDLADPDRRGCMAVNTAAELARADPEATEHVRRMLDRTEGAFRELIREGQRSGEIDAGRNAAALGSLLMNTVVGTRIVARVAEGPERLDRVISAAIDCL
ncbi:TetR/AcrR family transcriptional regulator [Actinomadura parmotrematis]|uniref:TetR/AcrR family transcriptional regulator n=1 Tax=Actinomadura parmotrematis TaxID=2864039 RepID=A0ABS7FNR4_9ACTN|nr:TetR/AcrR family transcriptional regulator [Actinomadura parmotrematis]MBW8482014.1 TetR/AcrR family transcriptional regulator [Actinomadura parmotrematis]